MKNPEKTVQLNVEIPEAIKRGLKAVAAMRGVPLKDLAAQILMETAKPYVSSSVPPGEAAAGPVAVAALTGRGPTPPVGGSIGAASSPARAGRTAKARQQ
jgi:hypothetical protein